MKVKKQNLQKIDFNDLRGYNPKTREFFLQFVVRVKRIH